MATDRTTEPRGPSSPAGPAPAGDEASASPDTLELPAWWAGEEVEAAGSTGPGWFTLADGAPQDGAAVEPVQPRRVFAQLVLGVVAALLAVGVLGTLAARQLAEREAVNDAATMAGVLAEAVVEPALTEELVAGDPGAAAAFGDRVGPALDPDSVVRVKLWRPDGYVLYADEPQLVGRTFPLGADQRVALAGPTTIAEVSRLEASENAFESGDRLVEVYRPVWSAGGRQALFEIYVSYEPVAARTSQLWRGFAGVTASSLLLLVVIATPLVVHLLRRLGRAESQRVALLQRAVDASTDERRRIAASLHDGPVQELAATSFTVSGASATAAARGDRALADDLGAAAAAVRASIRSLRTLLVDIYPPSLTRSGIVVALHDLAQAVGREGLRVEVDADGDDDLALTPDAQRLVYRVAQECLRNAATHAGPASVTVSLRREGPSSVSMDVVDDGLGFDVDAVLRRPREGHLGMQLLGDATSTPGVVLRVSSTPGRGAHWRLELDGPVAETA